MNGCIRLQKLYQCQITLVVFHCVKDVIISSVICVAYMYMNPGHRGQSLSNSCWHGDLEKMNI